MVPVSIFLRAAGRAPTSLVLGTERHRYLIFDYVACKLAEMPAAQWLDSGNLVARLNLPNMDGGVVGPGRHLRQRGAWPARDGGGRCQAAKYLNFIDIYARLTENEERRYRRRYPEGGRALLERQFRRRFGPLSGEAAELLRRAPEADLEAWAVNVLDAGTLDEVFGTTR